MTPGYSITHKLHVNTNIKNAKLNLIHDLMYLSILCVSVKPAVSWKYEHGKPSSRPLQMNIIHSHTHALNKLAQTLLLIQTFSKVLRQYTYKLKLPSFYACF